MPKIISISQKPTFDLNQIEILAFQTEDKMLFLKSKQIFKFDKVYGTMQNRSRVLRQTKIESGLVESVIAATIDAGFCGYLFWKLKLTQKGQKLILDSDDYQNSVELRETFSNCQQLHLSKAVKNYYDGDNQTDLLADIVFKDSDKFEFKNYKTI